MTQVALNLKELLPSSKQSYFIVVMIRTVLVLSILFVALAVAFFGETVGFDYPGLGCIPVSSTVPGIYQDMIITSSGTSEGERREEKRFLYDIVAHGRNGIHVDKFDYISCDSWACGLGCNFSVQKANGEHACDG